MRNTTISGDDLRSRIDRLGLTYREAADRLGLSPSGLHQQMRGERGVSRQTELLLAQLEREQRARTVRTPVEAVMMTTEHDADEVHLYSYPREGTGRRTERANPAPPAPPTSSGIITSAGLQAQELRLAINRLDDYLSRFEGLDGVEEYLRPLRRQLNARLDATEQQALVAKQRRQRQPKMTMVKRPRGST